jgi:hypothetical protein
VQFNLGRGSRTASVTIASTDRMKILKAPSLH